MTLAALQSRLRDVVAACPLLAGRPVLIEEKGNLVSDVETALATFAIAAVIAPASGQAKDAVPRGRCIWDETLEIVFHRGPVADPDSPSLVDLIDQVRAAVHGAVLAADAPQKGTFKSLRHDLRENGDGTYARVLIVGLSNPV